MTKTLKKIFTTAAVSAVALTALIPASASAYGVTAASFYFTNSCGTPINSISKNKTVKAVGSVTYDATCWGWLPMPSSCYYNLETPAGSLNKPSSSTSGSWTSATWSYVGYADYSRNAVYRMSKSFNLASKKTKTVTASTTSKSYTTGWASGSVNTGSGHSSDGSSIDSFKTL